MSLEGTPGQVPEIDSFEHSLRAVALLEEKYRRKEIRLEDLLYGYDRMQEQFYKHFNPDEPHYYNNTWQAAVTPDGHHYTKLKSINESTLTPPQVRNRDLNFLLERIGQSLNRETINLALEKAQDPNLSDEEFQNLRSQLVSLAFGQVNSKNYTE